MILALVTAFVIGNLGGQESQRRDQTPAAYRQAAKADAQRACIGADRLVLFECVYDKVEAGSEQAHDEQDLSAQQRAASAALIMAILSFGSILVSIAGIYYIRRTIRQGQEALSHAKSEQRPYLFIDKFDVEHKPSDTPEKTEAGQKGEPGIDGLYSVTIWLKNFGTTPARNIRTRSHCYLTEDLYEVEPIDLTAGFVEAGVAAPGHHRRTFNGFYISPARSEPFRLRQMFVVLRIIYLYTDDAGAPYEEGFDYFMDEEGLRKKLFYVLSDRTRERARIEREQRNLFEEDGFLDEEVLGDGAFAGLDDLLEEEEPAPTPSHGRMPAQKAKQKAKPKRRLVARPAAKPRPKLKPKAP